LLYKYNLTQNPVKLLQYVNKAVEKENIEVKCVLGKQNEVITKLKVNAVLIRYNAKILQLATVAMEKDKMELKVVVNEQNQSIFQFRKCS